MQMGYYITVREHIYVRVIPPIYLYKYKYIGGIAHTHTHIYLRYKDISDGTFRHGNYQLRRFFFPNDNPQRFNVIRYFPFCCSRRRSFPERLLSDPIASLLDRLIDVRLVVRHKAKLGET